jgi:hypothetical protein
MGAWKISFNQSFFVMKMDKSRDKNRGSFERDFKIKKVDANKQLSKDWKRFLETEDFDD